MSTKEIHPTMQRIYDATSLNGSDLAASINESPQTIYNWDKRGVSKKELSQFLKNIKLILVGFLQVMVSQGLNQFLETLQMQPLCQVAGFQ